MSRRSGMVYLIGAGPGDPELITVRGRRLLQQSDVVIHDRLIGPGLLDDLADSMEIVDAGKAPGGAGMSQEAINELIIHHALQGKRVARLKGGDPYLFGRGWEELQACRTHGVPCRVIPGISSALAGPAAAGIPVTLRGVSRNVMIATAQQLDGRRPDVSSLVAADTLILLMGRSGLADVARRLIRAGRKADTPALCIEQATLPGQRQVGGTLETVAAEADRAGLRAPVVVIVGETAALAESGRCCGPLTHRKVVVTRARSYAANLREALQNLGAEVIEVPLIDIEFPAKTPDLDAALQDLESFHWVVFTSVNGVRGFWRRMDLLKLDARALASCAVAAIGSATAGALAHHHIRADLIPPDYRAAAMVEALRARLNPGDAVLYPCSHMARPELADGLGEHGARVTAAMAYRTLPGQPCARSLAVLQSGVDAILFNSPSAVRQFSALGLASGSAVIGCIGPTTAEAARHEGLTVEVVPEEHYDTALVQALCDHFCAEVRT